MLQFVGQAGFKDLIIALPIVVALLFIGVADDGVSRFANEVAEGRIDGHPFVISIFDVDRRRQLIEDRFYEARFGLFKEAVIGVSRFRRGGDGLFRFGGLWPVGFRLGRRGK